MASTPIAESVEGSENPYITSLVKNMRAINKKLSAMHKTDAVIKENPNVSLDELVAQRKINLDQKASALKKPQLQAQLAALEEQVQQYRKFDAEFQTQLQKQKEELTSLHGSELEKIKQEAQAEALAHGEAELKKKLLVFSQFLRAAAAKRNAEEDSETDENRAFEGTLLLVPKMPKNTTSNSLEKEERVLNHAKQLKPNDVVQVQLIGREVLAGLVIENRPAEMTVVVDVLFDGERVEVEWKYICVLDPDQSQRPQPSPNAVPMPEGMNKQLVSANNRQDGVPSQDEAFTEDSALKWQEFYNSDFPPTGYRLNRDKLLKTKVDLDKADQLYYYLPTKSTEARSFFTDKVGGTEHVSHSNFLDRVAPPKPPYSYSTQRPSLAASQPAPRSQPPYGAANNFQQGFDKPYTYKPRNPTRPHMLAIDTQALANQRNFAAQAGQPGPHGQMLSHPSYTQANGPLEPSQSGGNSGTATPLRPFSQDQYYSTRTLPAAWQGEYSSFQREVRKSQGAQTLPRPSFQPGPPPPLYKSVSQQMADLKQQPQGYPYAPGPPTGHPAGNPSQHPPVASGPSPSTQYYQSPYGAPPTPATVRPTSGHETHLPNNGDGENGRPGATRTPSASISSGTNGDRSRPVSQQWTPPSQRPGATPTYHGPPFALPPVRTEEPKPKWPSAIHQTPQEFQNQLTYAPSIASRDGAHLRMMRDKGYMQPVHQHVSPYGSYQSPQHPRPNGLGQPYNAPGQDAHIWTSPKAPIVSPISDPNTPGTHRHQQKQHQQQRDGYQTLAPAPKFTAPSWESQQPKPGLAPLTAQAQAQNPNGQGPMLPQMHTALNGGPEAWRYAK